jgi:hypothetical protein
VNPGKRAIEARAPGYHPATTEVTLVEGQNKEVVLTLERAPEGTPPPPPVPVPTPSQEPAPPPDSEDHFPIAATLGFGIGAAGIVVGAITGGLSLAKTSELDERCGEDQLCPAAEQETLDDAELLANISNVGFAVGAAGLLFGVIAVFTFDSPSQSARVEPLIGPGAMGLRGRF